MSESKRLFDPVRFRELLDAWENRTMTDAGTLRENLDDFIDQLIRDAVWGALQKIQEHGVSLESIDIEINKILKEYQITEATHEQGK